MKRPLLALGRCTTEEEEEEEEEEVSLNNIQSTCCTEYG
jgi:hypothetical protein